MSRGRRGVFESMCHGRGGSRSRRRRFRWQPVSAAGGAAAGEPPAEQQIDLSKVSARTNLNETAFFFPHLVSDKDGRVTMKFTMPEALTEWKFLGFAHDSQMRGGSMLGHRRHVQGSDGRAPAAPLRARRRCARVHG